MKPFLLAMITATSALVSGEHFFNKTQVPTPTHPVETQVAGWTKPPEQRLYSVSFDRYAYETDLEFASRMNDEVHGSTWHCDVGAYNQSWIEGVVGRFFDDLWSEGLVVASRFSCGFCHQRAYFLHRALGAGGVRSEVYGLNGHVVIRAHLDGKWYFADPDYGVGPFREGTNPEPLYAPRYENAALVADMYMTTENNGLYTDLRPVEKRQRRLFLASDLIAALLLFLAVLPFALPVLVRRNIP